MKFKPAVPATVNSNVTQRVVFDGASVYHIDEPLKSVVVDFHLLPPHEGVLRALDFFLEEAEQLTGFTPFELSYLNNGILKCLEEISIQQYIRRSIHAGERIIEGDRDEQQVRTEIGQQSAETVKKRA